MDNITLKNKHHIKYLHDQLKSGDFVGFMIFTGQADMGKFDVATQFANSVLCEKSGELSCGRCQSCKLIEKKNHPDLLTIDGGEAIKISQIREMRRNLFLRPYLSSHKVAVINDAHLLTQESANALLKVLEEPPEDSIIVLITPDKTLLPETVISRGQMVSFGTKEVSDNMVDEDEVSDILNILESTRTLSENFLCIQQYTKERSLAMSFIDVTENVLRQIFLLKNNIISEYNRDCSERLEKIEERYSENSIVSLLELTARSREYLKSNLSSRFVIENIIINIEAI